MRLWFPNLRFSLAARLSPPVFGLVFDSQADERKTTRVGTNRPCSYLCAHDCTAALTTVL